MEYFWPVLLFIIVVAAPPFRRAFFFSDASGRQPVAKGEPAREEFFDSLKGVAIVAVVLIHVVYFYLKGGSGEHQSFLWWANNLSRFAIPIFFIVSGILLDPLKADNYWTKKIVRLLIPYLAVASSLAFFQEKPLGESIWRIVTGKALAPFYFIIVLFQFYLIYPWIVRFRGKGWFLPGALAISIGSYFFAPSQHLFGFPTFFQYLFFFAYGIEGREFFLRPDREKQLSAAWLWIFLVQAYVFFLLVFPEYYYNNQYFFGPAVFNILFFFKGIKWSFIRSFAWFGRNSLWIFLVHFPLVGVIQAGMVRTGFGFQAGFWLTFFGAFVFSALLAAGLDKVYSPIAKLAYRREED